MKPIRLAVAGASGRTGSALIRLALEDPQCELVAAITAPDDPRIGESIARLTGAEASGVQLSADCAQGCDVFVEFTLPPGFRQWLSWCVDHRMPFISGTTGLTGADFESLKSAAHDIPVLWAPNMSIGVSVLQQLVAEAARRLGAEWHVEICETHHARKVDAPSGTARGLLRTVREARGDAAPEGCVRHGRHGEVGPRADREIGMHSLRLGDVVGRHEVQFAGDGELLTLRHDAFSRDIFARGALRAARWLVGKPPGRYGIRDVLYPTDRTSHE